VIRIVATQALHRPPSGPSNWSAHHGRDALFAA
jgi:hypothetical protein